MPVDIGSVIFAYEVEELSLICVEELEDDSNGIVDVVLLV